MLIYGGGAHEYGEAERYFTADMQLTGLRLPRSPPQGLTLLAARQYIFEGFKSLKYACYVSTPPSPSVRHILTFHRRRGSLQVGFTAPAPSAANVATINPPQNMTQAAMTITTPIRIPVSRPQDECDWTLGRTRSARTRRTFPRSDNVVMQGT